MFLDHQPRGRSGRENHEVRFLARTGVPPIGVPMTVDARIEEIEEEEESLGHGCSEERPNCTSFFGQRFVHIQ